MYSYKESTFSPTITLTCNNRSRKLITFFIMLLMFSSVLIFCTVAYLISFFKNYEDAIISSMTLSLNTEDYRCIKGTVEVTFQNFLPFAVKLHNVHTIFRNEQLSSERTDPTTEKLIPKIFGFARSKVGQEISGKIINLKVSGSIDFPNKEALSYILSGMSTFSLTKEMVFDCFLDVSIKIFGLSWFEKRTTVKIQKIQPFSVSTTVPQHRVYFKNKTVAQAEYSELSEEEKKKRGQKDGNKILFREDFEHIFEKSYLQIISFIKENFCPSWRNLLTGNIFDEIEKVKVMLAFKFYHMNFKLQRVPLIIKFYEYKGNYSLPSHSERERNKLFQTLENFNVFDFYIILNYGIIRPLIGTNPDSYSCDEMFNDRFLLDIRRNENLFIDGTGLRMAIEALKRGLENFLVVAEFDTTRNHSNYNFTYNEWLIKKMGKIFYFINTKPSQEVLSLQKEYINNMDENEWSDDYGESL